MSKFFQFLRTFIASQQRQAGDHLDANLLLAFAERNVPGRERALILAHLAECPACREILALSSRANAPDALPAHAPVKRDAIRWGLRITAVATVIFSVVVTLHRPSFFKNSRETSLASKSVIASNPPSPIASPLLSRSSEPLPAKPKTNPAKNKHVNHGQREALAARNAPPAQQPEPQEVQPKEVLPNEMLPKQVLANPSAARSALQPSPAISAGSLAPSPPHSDMIAPNPMFTAGRAGSVHMLMQPVHSSSKTVWSLDGAPGDGTLQKSSDDGKTWRTIRVDNETRFYSLSATGSIIWVGGAGGKLFCSTDEGLHWSAISIADESESLTGDIVGIDVHGDSITLRTSLGAVWISSDAGVHWHSK